MNVSAIPSLFGLPPEITVFLGVLLVILAVAPLVLSAGRPNHGKMAKKLQQRLKTARELKPAEGQVTAQSLRKTEGDKSLPFMTRFFGQRQSVTVLRDRLARAGVGVTAERYLLYTGLAFCALTALPALLGKSALISALLAVIAAVGLPHFVIGFKIKRQTKKFLLLFPDAIDLIVRGLRAGLPVTESIKMVARELEEPVAGVFQTITEKMALGIPLEKTLYETAKKYGITEFDFFVTSIVLQRETGGNLSEILANLSEALRARTMMRMKIKAMSSEAKASMYIIGVLPFFVMGALSIMSPEYLIPLFNDFRGNIALAIAGGMLGSGIFIMTRMTQFEI